MQGQFTERSMEGFSKLSKTEKIERLAGLFPNSKNIVATLVSFWHSDREIQKLFDQFSENTISNFYLPFGVVPGMVINGQEYCVPMAIEESSVVAAASRSAKFWAARGGFQTRVLDTTKVGQVHFKWPGPPFKLQQFFTRHKNRLLQELFPLEENMRARGGGIKNIQLVNKTHEEPDYYQLLLTFETCEAMGANFINTILEASSRFLKEEIVLDAEMLDTEKNIFIIMSILSNYTPDCRVLSSVECSMEELADPSLNMEASLFAEKILTAVQIAKIDPYRATTHNKGIMNGVDAVVIATGNDFRAVEACAHAYAARDGQYRGLSTCHVSQNHFVFSLEMPLAVERWEALPLFIPYLSWRS
jgi:hydroxymethylglutaryl-CoA reductase